MGKQFAPGEKMDPEIGIAELTDVRDHDCEQDERR